MRIALVAALWSCLLAPLPGSGEIPDPPSYPASDWRALPEALVTEVIDGDTLTLDLPSAGLTVQIDLAGVRGPGLKQPFGPEAAFFMNTLAMGEQVRVLWTDEGQADDRGRRRAVVYREPDGLCLNLELARAGLARAEPGEGGAGGAGELVGVIGVYANRAEALGRGWVGGGEGLTLIEPMAVPEPIADEPVTADSTAEPTAQDNGGKYFVTKSGSKYHKATCRFVSDTSSEITLEEAKGRYEPCRVCKPSG